MAVKISMQPAGFALGVPSAPSSSSSRHCVTLLTFGVWEPGGDFVLDFFADHDHRAMWHRMDYCFSSTTHLRRRGTHEEAQEQLLELYPSAERLIDRAIEDCLHLMQYGNIAHCFTCRHGHHRSVAFAELVAKRMRHQHPDIQVNVVHLDHTESWLQERNIRGRRREAFEDLLEEPYANAIHLLRRNLLPELLHHCV